MYNLSPYHFRDGFRDGIPIGVGYLSVSIGFGIMAVAQGLPVLAAIIMSLTNMTSAGQVAGLAVITAGGTIAELALSQLIINMRYSLMAISMSQKMDATMRTGKRMIIGFDITDEIFAVSTAKPGLVGFAYMLGLILPCVVGWTLGTTVGAIAGNIMPLMIRNALSIAIYGMFIAIVVPPAKTNATILAATLLAAAISCCFYYFPCFASVGSGFTIIISGIVAAALLAFVAPVKSTKWEGGEQK